MPIIHWAHWVCHMGKKSELCIEAKAHLFKQCPVWGEVQLWKSGTQPPWSHEGWGVQSLHSTGPWISPGTWGKPCWYLQIITTTAFRNSRSWSWWFAHHQDTESRGTGPGMSKQWAQTSQTNPRLERQKLWTTKIIMYYTLPIFKESLIITRIHFSPEDHQNKFTM